MGVPMFHVARGREGSVLSGSQKNVIKNNHLLTKL